jgi:ubiquinone/menaquinone biosynthesis C-methylase UbiE
MLARDRERWQQPTRVLRAAGVRHGAVVADVGAGPGYFTLALARAVGRRGRVYAVDPGVPHLERLRERLMKTGVRNVTPVLSRGDDPSLPPGACDVVLIVNTYHHFPDGPAFLRRLAQALRRGGRLAAIDFEKRETPVGPPVDHRVAREDFLRDARRAGFTLVSEHDFLPYQYFLVLGADRAASAESTLSPPKKHVTTAAAGRSPRSSLRRATRPGRQGVSKRTRGDTSSRSSRS